MLQWPDVGTARSPDDVGRQEIQVELFLMDDQRNG
jgi:hypothetical protein